jgi:hypothetical protein
MPRYPNSKVKCGGMVSSEIAESVGQNKGNPTFYPTIHYSRARDYRLHLLNKELGGSGRLPSTTVQKGH